MSSSARMPHQPDAPNLPGKFSQPATDFDTELMKEGFSDFDVVYTLGMQIAFNMANRSDSGSIALPHFPSIRMSLPPMRFTISDILVPNTPLTPTTTSSPGSTKLTKQVSIPALPVPETGIVYGLSVWKRYRSNRWVSSIIDKK
jgi:hypothetical protein